LWWIALHYSKPITKQTNMGTYIYLKPKNTSEENLKRLNKEIEALGYASETHNGIVYGAFKTFESLSEDARFMNEEEEGLRQVPHIERPITPEYLSENFFWNKVGFYVEKISCYNDDRLESISAALAWANMNPDQVDESESSHWKLQELDEDGRDEIVDSVRAKIEEAQSRIPKKGKAEEHIEKLIETCHRWQKAALDSVEKFKKNEAENGFMDTVEWCLVERIQAETELQKLLPLYKALHEADPLSDNCFEKIRGACSVERDRMHQSLLHGSYLGTSSSPSTNFLDLASSTVYAKLIDRMDWVIDKCKKAEVDCSLPENAAV